jgi:hypothetical protein
LIVTENFRIVFGALYDVGSARQFSGGLVTKGNYSVLDVYENAFVLLKESMDTTLNLVSPAIRYGYVYPPIQKLTGLFRCPFATGTSVFMRDAAIPPFVSSQDRAPYVTLQTNKTDAR